MPATALTEARILTPGETIERGSVVIDGGRIVEVGSSVSPPRGAQVVRLPNLTLAPGFIDLHVHGGGGFALATREAQEIRQYARWAATKGVTSFLATVCGPTVEQAVAFLEAAAQVVGPVEGGAELLGLNLEGPFINPARRGALPEGWPALPEVRTFQSLAVAVGGHLKLMTVAPELPGAEAVLEAALAAKVTVALGHTGATYEQARRAFAAGASHLTHAFNAMRPFHHREPGPVGAALDSPGATVEVIADGVHLHAATVALLLRALGPQRAVLVTDGVPPAGLSASGQAVGGREVRVEGARVTLPEGTIAGSAATMDQVVRNVVRWGAAGLADAVGMASTVPAQVVGMGERKGRIALGYDADLVALDEDLAVVMTWVGGQMVHFWPKGWQG